MAEQRARRWHKAQNKLRDHRFLALTLAARGVLCCLEEMVNESGEVRGNLTMIAGWLVGDRKTIREALEAIKASGILEVSTEDMGKAGVFYTVTNLEQTLTEPQADPEQAPSRPQADPNRAPDKSRNNAGFRAPSLRRVEEKRVEESRRERDGAHGARASEAGSEDDDIPFSAPLDPPPDDLPEVELKAEASGEAQGEQSVAKSKGPRPAPKPRHEYHAEFAPFWDEYPNKVNKVDAAKLHKALLREGVEPSDVLEGLARYRASEKWARDAGRYVEAPDVWLRNRRFEDHPAAARGEAVTTFRPTPSYRPERRTVAEVGASWLEKRRQAGL